jgi:VanZ family protein
MYETISVAELFEEELEALEEQYDTLIEDDSQTSKHTAEKIAHVIEYFKLRLGVLEESIEEAYGAASHRTLH